jgi:tRNA(Ile)-lysidine synthase
MARYSRGGSRPGAVNQSVTGLDLESRFLTAFQRLALPGDWKRLVVAVSGGADSLALLHLLHATRSGHGLELVVAHADHGIHPESADVARKVEGIASALGIPAHVGRLSLGSAASETAARAARHTWLERVRLDTSSDGIALAHHLDDQAETVLLRVLAGSGPAGLAAMARRRGVLIRPLLGFRRSELEEWVRDRRLSAWDDPANRDPAHRRSWIRVEILPLLAERVRDVIPQLARVARHAASDRAAWDRVIDVLPDLDVEAEADGASVAARSVVGYDSPLARAVVQAVARRAGLALGPSRARRVVDLARKGTSGRLVELGAGWCAELAFGRLRFFRAAGVPGAVALLAAEGSVSWGGWRIRWRPDRTPSRQPRDGSVAWFIPESMSVRGPAVGDRLVPLGGTGHRPVARCLQEAKVPRGRRAGWPLVVAGPNVLWIAGICRAAAAVPAEGEEAVRVEVDAG